MTALLEAQHPDLTTRAVQILDSGWDNVVVRLGDDLALRIPRRLAAVERLEAEIRWLPALADRVGLDVPRPVRVGRPDERVPWVWSIVHWVPGRSVDPASLDAVDAARLARALRRLHVEAPSDAPSNRFRGVPLMHRDETFRVRCLELGEDVARPLLECWREGCALPPSDDHVWVHGDLHPRNLVAAPDGLTGIVDWGDLTSGDPATDLACAWMAFGSAERETFRREYGGDSEIWMRARAWAAFFAVSLTTSGEPRHAVMGRVIARQLEETPTCHR